MCMYMFSVTSVKQNRSASLNTVVVQKVIYTTLTTQHIYYCHDVKVSAALKCLCVFRIWPYGLYPALIQIF